MTPLTLQHETRAYRTRGGVSAEARPRGFTPAFLDRETGHVLISRFADGRPAPIHLLDGLPEDVVVRRSAAGRVLAVKDSVVAGFVWRGGFLTRAETAELLGPDHPHVDDAV